MAALSRDELVEALWKLKPTVGCSVGFERACYVQVQELLDAYLAQVRAETQAATLERVCKAVCEPCRYGLQPKDGWHSDDETDEHPPFWRECKAIALRRAFQVNGASDDLS